MPAEPVTDPTDREAFARALARTYGEDSWDRVQQYERVRAYDREHPDASPATVADECDVAYNPAYQWTEQETTPDPARAIAAAEQQGWLPFEWGESPTPALVALTGWTISRGRVHPTRYDLRLNAGPHAYDEADGLVQAVGLEPDREQPPSGEGEPLVRVKEGAHLGRVLAALGVPTDGSASVPEWVWGAPRTTQLTFVRGVLYPRGRWDEGDERRLSLPLELGRAVESLLDRTLGTAFVEYRDGTLVLGQAAAAQADRPPLGSSAEV